MSIHSGCDPMEKIKSAMLPGFYTDARGVYGIVLGDVYISCFPGDEGKYDVTVDTIDDAGDFALCIKWESFDNAAEAIYKLREFVKQYIPRRNNFTSVL